MMLQYILECIAFQLVFLIIYDLFLKRETFFQWNRLYLIGTYIISLVLPWIKIEAMKTTVPEAFQGYPEFLWGTNDAVIPAIVVQESSFNISWEYTILFGGMLLASLFFSYKLYQIYALKRKGEVQTFKDFTCIIVSNSSIAFSFFKSIFLGDRVIEKEHENIVQHELVHIRQKHSYDLMFFELMRIVGWFNPLVYVYQSRVSELHEFIADAQVAKTNKKEQYEFLLSQVFQTQNISFINQFFKTSLIKKRIVMLTKEKSKQVLKLKYILLVPIILVMLAYTSVEHKPDDEMGTWMIQSSEDAELIAEINEEIDKEIVRIGSIEKVFFRTKETVEKKLVKTRILTKEKTRILTKREYFKEQLLMKMFFERMKPVEFGDDVQPRKPFHKIPLPSTSRYESYINRIEAFYILDPNLQFSIKTHEQQVGLIDVKSSYSDSSYLFEVENVKDLTGEEVRLFNNTLEEIFEKEENTFSDLILTDGEYAFRVFTGLSKKDPRVFENSNIEGLVERSGKTIKLNVSDTRHLSKGEKAQQEALFEEIRNSKKEDTLIVTDGTRGYNLSKNSTDKTNSYVLQSISDPDPIPFATVDEVPVFPGCEDSDNKRKCFDEKIQKHISKNFNYPKEAQEKGIQGRVNVIFSINKKGIIESLRMRGPDSLLEKEVERIIKKLPKMKSGKHKGKKVDVPFSIPINFKLYSDGPDYQILPEIGTSDEDVNKSIHQYNQVVAERNRLLQSSNKTNPVIVNLDQQLEALIAKMKALIPKIQQSDTSQKELEGQFLKILKEREKLKMNQSQLETEDVPFAVVDEVPIYPGCEAAKNKRKCFSEKLQKHIAKNFSYPKEAQEKGIQGRVSIMFAIAEDGSIQNIRKRGPDSLLENEAERIINRLPKMIPGKHKGENVKVPFSIPITFKLQGIGWEPDFTKLANMTENVPMLMLDGEVSNKEIVMVIDKEEIETIFVLKGEAAEKKYGDKGKNGVIEITTKKKE